MTMTARFGLPFIQAAQAQKHITHNEALRLIDAIVQISLLSRAISTPPAQPDEGAAYLIPATGEEAWAGHEGEIAMFQDGTWTYLTPGTGWCAYVQGEDLLIVFTGSAWRSALDAPLVGINTAADTDNRLSVKSDGVLFSHDDVTPGSGDIRQYLNRAGAQDVAALIFQTGYTAEAELGLGASGHFDLNVTADGTSWKQALSVDPADGLVRLNGASPAQTAQAFSDLYKAERLAEAGNAGLTRSISLTANAPSGSLLALASADNNNMLFLDGAYVKTLAKGEVFHGPYPAGTLIETSRGHCGVSAMAGGPMPLGHEAFAAREYLIYAFRFSSGTPADEIGRVHVAAGAVPSTVTLLDGAGSIVDGPVDLLPYGRAELTLNADSEFRLSATQPVFAAISARDGNADLRLLQPPATELIGWNRNARVSAMQDDTTVQWYRRTGASGSFTVSPGSPVDIFQLAGIGNDAGFDPDGAIILRADGPIAAFSGADGTGNEAIAWQPLATLAQLFALPLSTGSYTGADSSSIIVASPYAGVARVYDTAGTLVHEMEMTRSNGAAASPGDQLIPAAARFVPAETLGPGSAVGPGGWVETSVPAFVVLNSRGDPMLQTAGDETVLTGVTPDALRMIPRLGDDRLLRRLQIDDAGNTIWQLL